MMDDYEATRIVYSRILNLDPENASKIMGLLLLQDQSEKEIIRLAFGPESLIHSIILKAKNELNFNRISSIPISNNNNSNPIFNDDGGADFVDEFQIRDQFLCNGSVNENPDFVYSHPVDFPAIPTGDDGGGSWGEEAVIGWRPCLYNASGFCENGSGCRFFHSGGGGRAEMVEESSDVLLLPSKFGLQQRLSVGSAGYNGNFYPFSPMAAAAASDLILRRQQNEMRRAAAGLSTAEESSNSGRFRLERTEFCGGGMGNPAARQIYLTFPSDSSFKEEDVSKYFSIYGPVEDVRIPYQQKRMFGFVTFVYPDTVKLILAKGNPHFVCDSRVLVKPYKEKGKIPDKFRKQQMERGDFSSPCGTSTCLDSRDLHDLHLGGRMFYNTQEIIWRKKLEEQADLQQALELQALRVMSLQLGDVKKPHHHHSPIPFNQTLLFHSTPTNSQVLQENNSKCLPEIRVEPRGMNDSDMTGDSDSSNDKETDLQEISLEHNLPDSPFATTSYTPSIIEADTLDTSTENHSTASPFISTSTLRTPFKSFNCQYSSGHGAIGLYANTGGPTCRVGI